MARTLSSILIDVNAYTDLDASLPTGDELNVRTNYANLAVLEAADMGVLNEFNQILEVNPGSAYRVSLPANFRGFNASPKQASVNKEFEEILPQDRFDKEATDNYVYVIGNPASGYTAVFNNLTANATISIDYQRYPSGFSTLTDVCELPDDSYVVEKIKSYVLQSRTDERFPFVDNNAQLKLKNMTGRADKTPMGGINRTPQVRKYVIGE